MSSPRLKFSGGVALTLFSLAAMTSAAPSQSTAEASVYSISASTLACYSSQPTILTVFADCTPVGAGPGTAVAVATGNVFESQSTAHAPGGVGAVAVLSVEEPFLLTGTVNPATMRVYYDASLVGGSPFPAAIPPDASCIATYGVGYYHPATFTYGFENGILSTCAQSPSYAMQRGQTGMANSGGPVSVLPPSVLLPFVSGGPSQLLFTAATQAELRGASSIDVFAFANLRITGLQFFDLDGRDVSREVSLAFDSGREFHIGAPVSETVPEPTTLTLLATGLAGVVGTRRRRTHVLPSDAHGRDHRA